MIQDGGTGGEAGEQIPADEDEVQDSEIEEGSTAGRGMGVGR